MNRRASVTSTVLSALIVTIIILIHTGVFQLTSNPQALTIPLFILLGTVILARIAKQILHAYFDRASRKLRVFDRTRYALFGKLVSVVIWIIGLGVVVSQVPQLRAASISLFAGAGVLAVIIGFATQKTFGNVASGVFIATFQPYRIGDRLNIMGEYGMVSDINLRHTTIETWDNRRIIIPNSKMDEEVIDNYTIGDPAILGVLEIGISYDANLDRARAIIIEEISMHPDFFDYQKQKDMISSSEKVIVRATGLTDSAVTLKAYYWAYDQPTNIRMRAELLEKVKKRFDTEGIEIPFPYRTLVYKNDITPKKRVRQAKTKQNTPKTKGKTSTRT